VYRTMQTGFIRAGVLGLLALTFGTLLSPVPLTRGSADALAALRGTGSPATVDFWGYGYGCDNPSIDLSQDTSSTPSSTQLWAQVKDEYGYGVYDVEVSWTTDNGTLSSATSRTDPYGYARVYISTTARQEITCNVTATASGAPPKNKPIVFSPNIYPRDYHVEKGFFASAGIGSERVVPLSIAVLKKDAPPGMIENSAYNWPPYPNVKLKVRVGKLGANGVLEPDAAWGSITIVSSPDSGATDGNGPFRPATTNADGMVIINYKPPTVDPDPNKGEPKEAIVWLEDVNRRYEARRVGLYAPSD